MGRNGAGQEGTRRDIDSQAFRAVAREGRDSAGSFAPPGAGSIPAASTGSNPPLRAEPTPAPDEAAPLPVDRK